MSLVGILVVLIVLSLLFGGVGVHRGWGGYGWSPLGIILLILVLCY
jgi:hypothetical protein